MKCSRPLIFSVLLAVLFSVVFLDGYALAEDDLDILVIANSNAPQKNLSMEEIQNIFTGKITMWSSNEKIIIALLKDDQIHKAFLKKYVKRNSTQFKNTWRQMVFTGKGDTPKKFDTIKELISFVSGNRLAIGYITNSASDSNILIISK